MTEQPRQRGQTLVLFALFLTVLLGVSALAVDYANWLLTDRALFNVADHAALAGASVFNQDIQNQSCSVDPGATLCNTARVQAWASLSQELKLSLPDATISCLATANTPASGWMNASGAGCTAAAFGHRIWVSTPPSTSAYTQAGGALSGSYGIVFVRVDRSVQTYFANVFGLHAGDRTGWATAGVLPTDYALSVFCRDNTSPGTGSCTSKGVGVEGNGGITLVRGDIGSNQSLQITANTGSGAVLQSGNVFLVNGSCGSSTWNCPPATAGGISDGNGNAKNAFHIPPLSVPHYTSPLTDVGVTDTNCIGATSASLCVPYRPAGSTSPGDWSCNTSGFSSLCGTPTANNGSISCAANVGGTPSRDLVPWSDNSVASFTGSPINTNNQLYENVDDDPSVPDADTTVTPANPPTDYVYSSDLNASAGSSKAVTFNLRPPFGIPQSGSTTIKYVVFKTNGGALSNDGNIITATVDLYQSSTRISTDPATRTLTGTPTQYSFTVNAGTITDYNSLSLRITFTTGSGGTNVGKRGGGTSWMEAYVPTLDPALPAMIPPGYYHSITIPDGGCAIMDPTGVYSGLKLYQKPGIYQFGCTGNGNCDSTISLGTGSYLIGDGVTLVFNSNFPDPTGGRGIVVGAHSALVLNTARVPGNPACTSETETLTYNPSSPLTALPVAAVCAAWEVDPADTTGLHPGGSAWPTCTNTALGQCVARSDYAPISGYRGVTFFFLYSNWPATSVPGRFQLSGTASGDPGIAFRGLLYAPYDDVKLTGGNGFNTIGQILAWTAKFAGQSTIYLDYPYERCITSSSCSPFLLEPTVNQ